MRYGNRQHRLRDLPYGRKELKLSDVLHKMSFDDWDALSFSSKDGMTINDTLSERERHIVASFAQWLGTPCGEAFLRESDFYHKEWVYKDLKQSTRKFRNMSLIKFMKWKRNISK